MPATSRPPRRRARCPAATPAAPTSRPCTPRRAAARPATAWASHRPPSAPPPAATRPARSEEHTSELQSQFHLVCRLLPEKKRHCLHPAPRSRPTPSAAGPYRRLTSVGLPRPPLAAATAPWFTVRVCLTAPAHLARRLCAT